MHGAFSANKGKKTICLSCSPVWVSGSIIAPSNRSQLVTSTLGSQYDTRVGGVNNF